ncbi:MAG: amino acid adenylation domain-containing protein [Azospirillaceae bacterium]|nr:amino acid adenylation domain-containing protein [Azospirillaceae bacterium]
MSVMTTGPELTPVEKRQLLERLLREKAAKPKQYPVSFGQERLWLVDLLQPGLSVYNLGTGIPFAGTVDSALLQRAVDELVRRHEVLRTRFSVSDGVPVQIVEPGITVTVAEVDLTVLPAARRPDEVRHLQTREIQRPFDLTQAPLVRFLLLRIGPSMAQLVFVLHHIISDGWSLGILAHELGVLYQGLGQGRDVPLPPLPLQYGRYAEWQRRWLKGETFDRLLSYWTTQLRGLPALMELPTDRPRPLMQSYRGANYSFDLPDGLCETLRGLGRRSGATLYMILLAAFQTLLLRYSGQEDVAVGTPIANRTVREHEALIGLFANTLVIRADLSGNPRWLDLLAQVREATLEAQAHQDLPFERLVEALQPARHLGYHPLFQVMFAYQNIPALDALASSGDEPDAAVMTGTTRFDLSMFLQDHDKGLRGTLEYSTDLFDQDRIVRMVGHFRTLLSAIAEAPQRRLWELPLLTAAERHLLAGWNATTAAFPPEPAMPLLFERQAVARPDAVAVTCGAVQCRYGELNRRANQLAHYLIGLGVGPDTLVALCIDRSVEMVVGVLAVLKAGGAYLPLDPDYPVDRLRFMLTDGRVPLLLSGPDRPAAFAPVGTTVIRLTADAPILARQPEDDPMVAVDPARAAYVIYTSGSTGVPKGVQVSRGALSNLLHALRQSLQPTQEGRWLALTTLSFDIAAMEIFLPLMVGAELVVAGREAALDGETLARTLAATDITFMQATPVTWRRLIETGWRGDKRMTLISGGEHLPQDLADRLTGDGATCWNLYGPTEATIYATGDRLAGAGAPVTIGRPIANLQAHVLDRHLNQVPPGVPGDLYLGGAGLAQGYLNRPDATADRFVPDHLGTVPGGRLYRTGDVVRLLADGRIDYLGRSDFQVKIRGFRIEPGEIEAVLRQHPAVRQAAVIARRDGAGQPAGPYLVAYVVAEGARPRATALYDHLRTRLPDYMLPTALVWLDALPQTPNGKIDRRALPAPDLNRSRDEGDFTAPAGPVEEIVAAAWMDVLNLDQIDARDDFFSLGGHSLTAARVMHQLCDLLGLDLPLLLLFKAPSVGGLSRELLNHPELGSSVAAAAAATLAGLEEIEAAARLDAEGLPT